MISYAELLKNMKPELMVQLKNVKHKNWKFFLSYVNREGQYLLIRILLLERRKRLRSRIMYCNAYRSGYFCAAVLRKAWLWDANPASADNGGNGLRKGNRKLSQRVNEYQLWERYDRFLNYGFSVIRRDDNRSVEQTLKMVEDFLDSVNNSK